MNAIAPADGSMAFKQWDAIHPPTKNAIHLVEMIGCYVKRAKLKRGGNKVQKTSNIVIIPLFWGVFPTSPLERLNGIQEVSVR